MFGEDIKGDVIFEVLKPLPNTSYEKGSELNAYITDAGNLSLGIFEGTKTPRTWRFMDHFEIDKLVEKKYIKKYENK